MSESTGGCIPLLIRVDKHLLLLLLLWSTYAHRQGVDILFAVCFFLLFVRLRIFPASMKLAASNLAQLFIGVQGRESPILGTLLIRSPKWGICGRAIRRGAWSYAWPVRLPIRPARWPRVRSACVDRRPSPKTYVLVIINIVVVVAAVVVVVVLTKLSQ